MRFYGTWEDAQQIYLGWPLFSGHRYLLIPMDWMFHNSLISGTEEGLCCTRLNVSIIYLCCTASAIVLAPGTSISAQKCFWVGPPHSGQRQIHTGEILIYTSLHPQDRNSHLLLVLNLCTGDWSSPYSTTDVAILLVTRSYNRDKICRDATQIHWSSALDMILR